MMRHQCRLGARTQNDQQGSHNHLCRTDIEHTSASIFYQHVNRVRATRGLCHHHKTGKHREAAKAGDLNRLAGSRTSGTIIKMVTDQQVRKYRGQFPK